MSSDITLSSAVRNNLLSLQNTSQLLGKTQERLATGLKVNSALDDPNAFFTASALNSRAGDLNRLLDSVGLAVETLQAADDGISAITKLVESAQATARLALQKPGPADEVTEATVTGDEAGVDLSSGSTAVLGSGEEATLSVNGEDLVLDDSTTVDDVLAFINGIDDLSASVADEGTNGAFQIDASNGASIEIAFSGTDAAALATATGLTADTTDPTTTEVDNSDRTSLAAQFNELLSQIDQLAADTVFNGNNLLAGDSLTVQFNEDGSSSLSITGVNFDSDGLGISAVTGDFQADTDVNAALDEMETAIGTLRQQASTFGSNLSVVEVRQDFTKSLINTLETGASNLTLADTNEEGANLLALQTRQQLSSVSLSMASQADQNVLRLF